MDGWMDEGLDYVCCCWRGWVWVANALHASSSSSSSSNSSGRSSSSSSSSRQTIDRYVDKSQRSVAHPVVRGLGGALEARVREEEEVVLPVLFVFVRRCGERGVRLWCMVCFWLGSWGGKGRVRRRRCLPFRPLAFAPTLCQLSTNGRIRTTRRDRTPLPPRPKGYHIMHACTYVGWQTPVTRQDPNGTPPPPRPKGHHIMHARTHVGWQTPVSTTRPAWGLPDLPSCALLSGVKNLGRGVVHTRGGERERRRRGIWMMMMMRWRGVGDWQAQQGRWAVKRKGGWDAY